MRLVAKDCLVWLWAPTSGNVYRRDAIALLAANPDLPNLRFATDAYYNFTVNALAGSAIIDKPLAVYRIHSANNFTKRATLGHLLTYEEGTQESARAAFFALKYIVANYESFLAQVGNVLVLKAALRLLLRQASPKRSLWDALSAAMTRFSFGQAVKGLDGRFKEQSILERITEERNREKPTICN